MKVSDSESCLTLNNSSSIESIVLPLKNKEVLLFNPDKEKKAHIIAWYIRSSNEK
jgi:hypothetical protein